MKIHVAYYAKLREERGCSEESLDTETATATALYEHLRNEHGFTLSEAQLRVVINEEFAAWDAPIHAGDTVVFIPPVAGG
ncbi:MAG: MoaD/ThiS family protein [Candidatus Hydrogenedentes bacterium]|nr:MoaD/ThiS family protein [Candidatus Hydrogenedentota bacterium]